MMKLAALFLSISFAAAGCMSPEDILEKLDQRTDEEIAGNVSELTALAGDPDETTSLRCYAMKVLGMLRHPTDYTVRTLGRLVSRGHDERIREWAAWALGELGDPGAVPHLNEALNKPISRKLGYRVVEAQAKLYPHLIDDATVTRETISALTTYSGNQKSTLPEVYTVLNRAVSTLDHLVDVLHRFLAESGRDSSALHSTYRAIYQLLELMEKRNLEVADNAPSQRMLLEKAFQDLSCGKVRANRTMALLAAQGIGRTANHFDMAARAAPGLIRFYVPNCAASVRLLSAWSMTRLQIYEASVCSALRKNVLAAETNPQVFDLLADIHDRTDEYDEIQTLFPIAGID